MKLTPWFHYGVPPVRPGWYEYDTREAAILRLYWNGQDFGYWLPTSGEDMWVIFAPGAGDRWRGLQG